MVARIIHYHTRLRRRWSQVIIFWWKSESISYNCFIPNCLWWLGSQLTFRAYIREPVVYPWTRHIIVHISRIYPMDNQPIAMAMEYNAHNAFWVVHAFIRKLYVCLSMACTPGYSLCTPFLFFYSVTFNSPSTSSDTVFPSSPTQLLPFLIVLFSPTL